ncbi:MAG: L-lactate dehydrogenase [Clostridiales bacterium]|nr:L-lactate dehydrogenase [Clostridiales bacterium]
MFRGKVVIVGAGAVGATTAFTLMLGGLFQEIVLIDINRDKAEGDALDIAHGVSFVKPVTVKSGDYSECKEADIVIITAGVPQKGGQTRLDLLKDNVALFKKIVKSIMEYAPSDVILMTVSNPVDILTYVTYRLSGLPKNQVIGSGTVLDTSRLKYMISRKTGVDARNCHTYIIGEHGDSEVAAWSVTNIGGMTMQEFCKYTGKCDLNDLDKMYNEVKNSAYEIIDKKGATYYAIAVAVARICECIAGDENSILTVSGIFEGEYGISGVALSVPTMVGGNGVERIFEVPFSKEEMKGLRDSATTLSDLLREIKM